jgi:hypothetical protein
MQKIKQILMDQDGYSEKEAQDLINDAVDDLNNRLMNPEDFGNAYDICSDWFGLEPDYIVELMALI